jgi:hypothetical protein
MINRFILPSALVSLGLFSTSCGLIVNGKFQKVNFYSSPIGAEVIVDGTNRGKSPILVDLARSSSHNVQIKLEGFQPFDLVLERKVSGWVWGNILFGGIIGLIVDASTGGMYKLTPEQVEASLKASPRAVSQANGNGMIIALTLTPDPGWQKVGQLSR